MQMRLDKFLGHAGVGSRKDIKSILKKNEVLVNGERAKSVGVRLDPDKDLVTVNGVKVSKQEFVYFAFNKPLGVISTTSDPQGRDTVVDYIDTLEKIYPIGRLDADTHGLLLLTNDGELTHQLVHPKYHVPKTYILTVAKEPTEEQLQAFRTGVLLRDGITLPAEIEIVNQNTKLETRNTKQIQNTEGSNFEIRISSLKVTLHEGRNRQIRRMCSVLDFELLDLQRIAFGNIQIGELKEGEYRELTKEEVKELKETIR